MKLEPIESVINRTNDVIFDETNASSRKVGLRQFKAKFDSMEQRIRRMENHVTNKAYDWDRRLNAD